MGGDGQDLGSAACQASCAPTVVVVSVQQPDEFHSPTCRLGRIDWPSWPTSVDRLNEMSLSSLRECETREAVAHLPSQGSLPLD